MRINDQNLTGISSSQIGRTQESDQANRQGRGAAAGAPGGDQIQLSNLASSLRALADETPERAAYLEKLAADVQADRYSVDALALSRKIIDDALRNRI